MALLEVRGLTRAFYGVHALRGAALSVEASRITGLIGPNGAGKTTLFNCISGVVPPDTGTVLFEGRNITGWRPDRVTQAGMVRTFQIARGFPQLTVLESLLLYGPGQRGERVWQALLVPARIARDEAALRDRAFAVARRLNLLPLLNNLAAELSGGQKKLLEIGRALMAEPKLILLDEPVAGVNPTLAREIEAHLRALVAEGMTVLLVEHHMDTVAELCDHVVVLAQGTNLAEGSFAEVAADPRVQEAYMGRREWAA
ncbi:MAG TPA: ABC transporter ATP-binding protein [Stellaceae bacterium]|jgi:branched-chain amino acid transport system ATP-binding protein/neutral amino acid transport system ATP-binding protein|nr:ABC transporter ATP-binding protein [Stellaceae bacterium]